MDIFEFYKILGHLYFISCILFWLIVASRLTRKLYGHDRQEETERKYYVFVLALYYLTILLVGLGWLIYDEGHLFGRSLTMSGFSVWSIPLLLLVVVCFIGVLANDKIYLKAATLVTGAYPLYVLVYGSYFPLNSRASILLLGLLLFGSFWLYYAVRQTFVMLRSSRTEDETAIYSRRTVVFIYMMSFFMFTFGMMHYIHDYWLAYDIYPRVYAYIYGPDISPYTIAIIIISGMLLLCSLLGGLFFKKWRFRIIAALTGLLMIRALWFYISYFTGWL